MAVLNQEVLDDINKYLEQENIKFHKYLVEVYYGSNSAKPIRELLMSELKAKGFFYQGDGCDLNDRCSTNINDLLKYFQPQAKISTK